MVNSKEDIEELLKKIHDENVLVLKGYFYSLGGSYEKLLIYKENGRWICISESEDKNMKYKWNNYSFTEIVPMLYNAKDVINLYCDKENISELDGLLRLKNVLEIKNSVSIGGR